MSVKKRELAYAKENFSGVMHTTLNPEGPGVVRIHLIPPAIENDVIASSVAILNGQDIVPIKPAWTILLSELIKEINKYEGRQLSDEDVANIKKATVKGLRKVYPFLSKKLVEKDIFTMMKAFSQVAYGQEPDEEIEYMNLGEYASFMKAPHRMDLLVSAMTVGGLWHCNQKCIHCYAAGQLHAEESELSTAEWKQIIDKCREAGIPQLTFTGGEPTMRPDLVKLIDYARWFVTRLNTNGIRLTPEFCSELKAASLDSMQITFYSANEEIHNKLVGAEKYADTVRGIENALAAGLNISINTPLCKLNQDYVKTLEFLYEKGVRYVTCSGLITTGNAREDASEMLQLSTDEIKEILKSATEYCYSHEMEISFTSPGWVDEAYCRSLGLTVPSCGACLSNMAITPSGNVVPCQSWLSDEPLGNMIENNWSDIWNGYKCKQHRGYSAIMEGKCPLRVFAKAKEV